MLSVALSRSLRTVGVTHHRVLWSPDFPPSALASGSCRTPQAENDRPADLRTFLIVAAQPGLASPPAEVQLRKKFAQKILDKQDTAS
jgi:hypothetical protein